MSNTTNIDDKQVQSAVAALTEYNKWNVKKKKQIFDVEHEPIHLIFEVKKIPKIELNCHTIIPITLPHTILTPGTEVLLITKDETEDRDYTETIEHYKDLLAKHHVTCVSEIMPLKSLHTEYQPFEAKIQLANRYDIVLGDNRIMHFLPKMLGKHFYGKRKLPIAVDLTHKNVKSQIDGIVENTRCVLTGRGSSSIVMVAHTNMPPAHIADNIQAAIRRLSHAIDGGPCNIRSFGIKTKLSISIPIYLSLASAHDVELPVPAEPHDEEIELEDVTTVEGAKVWVTAHGDITVISDETGEVIDQVGRPMPGTRKLPKRRRMEAQIEEDVAKSGTNAEKDITGTGKQMDVQEMTRLRRKRKLAGAGGDAASEAEDSSVDEGSLEEEGALKEDGSEEEGASEDGASDESASEEDGALKEMGASDESASEEEGVLKELGGAENKRFSAVITNAEIPPGKKPKQTETVPTKGTNRKGKLLVRKTPNKKVKK